MNSDRVLSLLFFEHVCFLKLHVQLLSGLSREIAGQEAFYQLTSKGQRTLEQELLMTRMQKTVPLICM